MMGEVTPMAPNTEATVEQVLAVILALVRGPLDAAMGKKIGVRLNAVSRWMRIHDRHVRNLRMLVRPEAREEYVRQLREKLGVNKSAS